MTSSLSEPGFSEPENPLLHDLPVTLPVWMSHSDRIVELPPGFRSSAYSDDSPIAAMADDVGHLGIQFHPEVVHTPQGGQLHAAGRQLRAVCVACRSPQRGEGMWRHTLHTSPKARYFC